MMAIETSVVMVFIERKRFRFHLKTACIAAIIVMTAFLLIGLQIWTINAIDYVGYIFVHFEAVAYSIIAIAKGGVCMADVPAQYGCYGEFLRPIFLVLGLGIVKLTVVLAALQLASMISVVLFATRLIRTPSLILMAGFSILLLIHVWIFLGFFDPYVQYFPIRFLFPAFSPWVAVWMRQNPSQRRLVTAGAFAGAAMAWNLDSGISVVGALATVIVVQDAALTIHNDGRRWTVFLTTSIKNIYYFIGAIVICIAFFVDYLEIRSAGHVDPANFVNYQKMFYAAGFMALPIPPLLAWWALPAFSIIIAGLYSLTGLFSCTKNSSEYYDIIFLCVLSIGIFLYYTGRSHILNLRLTAWPEVIIGFIFLIDCPEREDAHSSLLCEQPRCIHACARFCDHCAHGAPVPCLY